MTHLAFLCCSRIINWGDRCNGILGDWNHVAHFDTVHTNIVDGFPYFVWKPTKWQSERAEGGKGGVLLTSGKYNTACFKGHLWMAFHGLIVGLELDVGVNHDMRILTDCTHRYPMRCNEWGLGDLAYGGAPRYLCGVKASASHPINELDAYWTALVAFYRARVEQVIARLKRHAWCQQVFRGSYEMLMVHHTITGALTAMAIKQDILSGKPLFEVVGPWPHNI